MSRPSSSNGASALVHYTDPAWAVGPDGRADVTRAVVEAEILGADVQLRFGPRRDGRYVIDGEEFVDSLRGIDALVIYRAEITPEVINSLRPSCKVVARQGVGLDNLHVDHLAGSGVYAFHVPDYCVDEVAVHTIALLLALERRICVQNQQVKAGRWDIYAGGIPRRIATRTAAIVGFGRIGRAVARKLQTFYVTVSAYDPNVSGDVMAGYGVESRATLEELLADADVVLLHCPLDDVTRHIIDARALTLMKPGTLVVNTARGQLVDIASMHEALVGGAIGGYAADVFSPEDPNSDPCAAQLLALDNVVVTAHRAFLSGESELRLRQRVATEIAYVLATGQPPRTGRVA